MKKILQLVFSLLLLMQQISCTKVRLHRVCNVNEPLTDLPWLRQIVSENKADIIDKVIYRKNGKNTQLKRYEGFVILSGQLTYLYNCSGESLGLYGGIVYQGGFKDIKVLGGEKIYSRN